MAINPQINDMAWFGKPADLVGSFQQGMNLAEQSQRMKQSADMHPLKMADLQSATAARDANTNLAKQSYEYGQKTMDTKVQAAKYSTNLLGQQVEFGRKTMDARVGMTDSLRSLRDAQAKVAQGSIEADKMLRDATAKLANTRSKIAEDTIDSAKKAQQAANNQAVLDYDTNKRTQDAKILGIQANAKLTNLSARFAEAIQPTKIAHAERMFKYDMAKADHAEWGQRNTESKHDREERSRNIAENNIFELQTYHQNGYHDMVVNFDPDPSLTEAQRARVLTEKTRLSQNKAAQEAIAQRDIGAVQRMSTQASADSKVSKFNEDVREEFRYRFVGTDGFYTPEGLAAINRYNDSLELKKQIGEDEFDKLVANPAPTAQNPSRAAMISGSSSPLPIRSKEYLGGRLVIPEENALKEMRKMYAQKKKDALKGTVATDVEWEKFGIKFKGITNESISNDRQIAVGKALSDYLASDQWNDLGDAKERSEALATWFGTQQVASGSIKTVMGVADLNRRVQSGELKVGDMVLNLADGQFSPVSIGGQDGQAQPQDPKDAEIDQLKREIEELKSPKYRSPSPSPLMNPPKDLPKGSTDRRNV